MRRSPSVKASDSRAYLRLAIGGVALLAIGESATFFLPGFPRLFLRDEAGIIGFQFAFSYAVLFLAICLVVPLMMRLAAIALEPLLASAFAALGSLASRGIASNMRRFALTGTAFVVSLMMAVFLVGTRSTVRWRGGELADAMLGGSDIVVMSNSTFNKHGGKPLPGTLADEIAGVPGAAQQGL